MNTLSPNSSRRSQGGAALVIGLLLLVVLTLLAISSMNTTTLDLQMAGNEQAYQNAFQAAETGIEQAVASGVYDTSVVTTIPTTAVGASVTDTYQTTTKFDCAKDGISPVGGSSAKIGSGYSAYHFDTQSTGQSTRNATSVHDQSFYIVGPTTTC